MDENYDMNIYTWLLFSHLKKKKKKEGSPSICDNVNGPWGHYVNQGK